MTLCSLVTKMQYAYLKRENSNSLGVITFQLIDPGQCCQVFAGAIHNCIATLTNTTVQKGETATLTHQQ